MSGGEKGTSLPAVTHGFGHGLWEILGMLLKQRAHNREKDKDWLGFSSLGLHVLLMAGSVL